VNWDEIVARLRPIADNCVDFGIRLLLVVDPSFEFDEAVIAL
jgi:hypothetical protein